MKTIFLSLASIVAFFMCINTGICQPVVVNGSFDGTTTGWDNCGLGADPIPEVYYTAEVYDASPPPCGGFSCIQAYTDCGTGCAGNPNPDYVAEVDQGNSSGLCQDISGFTAGNSYTLYFNLSRRTSTYSGGRGAPDTTSIEVCLGTTCITMTRTDTTFGFTTSAWTFIAPASGILQLKITNNSTYQVSGPGPGPIGGDHANFGMVIGYIGFDNPGTTTGLKSFTKNNAVKLYPNPIEDAVTIEFLESAKNGELCIYSLAGSLQKKVTLSAASAQQVNLETLQKGMYLYEILEEGERKAGGLLQVK